MFVSTSTTRQQFRFTLLLLFNKHNLTSVLFFVLYHHSMIIGSKAFTVTNPLLHRYFYHTRSYNKQIKLVYGGSQFLRRRKRNYSIMSSNKSGVLDREEVNRTSSSTIPTSNEQQQVPIWDPINQIYVGGIVPQQQCIKDMLLANNGILYIFGYGSLCWNPGVVGESALADERVTSQVGKAIGYRRVWGQKSTDHRGIPSFPGIVCTLLTDTEFLQFRQQSTTLDESSSSSTSSLTEGLLYKVPPELVDECLQELDFREKGGYARDVINVVIDETGETIQSLLYRGTPDNPAFWPRAVQDLPFAAAVMASAIGPSGENHVYLNRLDKFLEATSSPSTLEKFDDTFILTKMANVLHQNVNLHFLFGFGSNQQNQLLLHNENHEFNVPNNNAIDATKITELVLCTNTETINNVEDVVTQIYAGGDHSGALTQNGNLYLFGSNANGQLGTSGINNSQSAPLPIVKALSGIKVKKAALGFAHTLIIEQDTSRLYAFGSNSRGQVDPTTISETITTPTTPQFITDERFIDIAAGVHHSAAITTGGELVTFGCGKYGQSLSSISTSSNNVSVGRWKPNDGSQLLRVTCGQYHTTVLDSFGRIWTVGANNYGQLGRNVQGTKTESDSFPGLVDIEGFCYDVSSGSSHTIVLAKTLNNSTIVYGWGRSDKGQLGTGSLEHVIRPTVLFESIGTPLTTVACGSEWTAIVDQDGTIYTCGSNEEGNLGAGTTAESSYELHRVTGATITTTPSYSKLQTAVAIAAGRSHLLAMKVVLPNAR